MLKCRGPDAQSFAPESRENSLQGRCQRERDAWLRPELPRSK